MNKKELKQAFEKEFENISVSNELKDKTLNSINSNPIKRTSHLPYIKNFAAIFVVTLLCLSIYFSNNKLGKNLSIDEMIYGNIEKNSDSLSTEDITLKRTRPSQESISNQSALDFNLYGTNSINSSTTSNYKTSGVPAMDTVKEEAMQLDTSESLKITTEDEFLAYHPEAEKIENGYIIYEDGKETLYIFNDNLLENIIIIN